ncbi:hypothetical protein Syun_026914 [Stephania yunnanensis]|uniref:Uncharacterized protein n=1 Tax=Stephania yunnanensis TaxID=152371 RepID=A0AAP0EM03_9MAGN
MEGSGGGGGGGGGPNSSSLLTYQNNPNHNHNNVVVHHHHHVPSMMMMPLMTSSSSAPLNPNNGPSTNTLFLPSPTTHNNNNNNNNNNAGGGYFTGNNNNNNNSESNSCSIRAKIMAHPHYPRLLTAYINCQKVGAPAEVAARLEEACAASEEAMSRAGGTGSTVCIGEDPGLDQFMEAYCEMLSKYEQELTKPFKEAMLFLSRIECQFKALTVASSDSGCGDGVDRNNGSSEDEVDGNNFIDPQAEDRELKGQLLRKYSGYLGSLKQEFMKKRKKGKLPKEARQQLLDWWSKHYKWPYPSESQKLALAESTGLDQKQINNWFINQRKRHWKPSEEMQLMVMDTGHPYYMDNVLGNPFPVDCTPTLL